jgi:predicted nucleotidyltransferase
VPAQAPSTALDAPCRGMRTSTPGQSALLMADVAELLAKQGVRYAVIGAMAAAVHGVVRASLDADAVVALQVREALALRQSLVEAGYAAVLRTGDVDDPIPALLEVKDSHGNRVDLLIGLRGMDPELMNRTRQVRLAEAILEVVGREDFIAMKAFAGGPVDLADACAVIDLDRGSLDLELLRRLAQRFGRDATRTVEDLIGAVD